MARLTDGTTASEAEAVGAQGAEVASRKRGLGTAADEQATAGPVAARAGGGQTGAAADRGRTLGAADGVQHAAGATATQAGGEATDGRGKGQH